MDLSREKGCKVVNFQSIRFERNFARPGRFDYDQSLMDCNYAVLWPRETNSTSTNAQGYFDLEFLASIFSSRFYVLTISAMQKLHEHIKESSYSCLLSSFTWKTLVSLLLLTADLINIYALISVCALVTNYWRTSYSGYTRSIDQIPLNIWAEIFGKILLRRNENSMSEYKIGLLLKILRN